MPNTTADLTAKTAGYLNWHGLHTGNQFTDRRTGALDVCAAAYYAAEDTIPPEFYTDEVTSLAIIRASAGAMQVIRAISDALDTEPCVTSIAPGMEVPDHIEHVSNWAATTPPFADRPPTATEVIGRILRTAAALRDTTAHQTAA